MAQASERGYEPQPGMSLLRLAQGDLDAAAAAIRRILDESGPQIASFLHLVFSLHEVDELRELAESAGFRGVEAVRGTRRLNVPPPEKLLWQYVHSTPMAEPVGRLDADTRAAFEREICDRWRQDHVDGDALVIDVGMTTVTARK